MSKKRVLKAIAVSMACLGMGALMFGGCKKSDGGHTHTWGRYMPDGESGHYRLTTCIDHATVRSKTEAHDGDTCSICGYTKNSQSSGVLSVAINGESEVGVGAKIQLNAVVTPNTVTASVIWSIESGSEFAEISSTGALTGKVRGTVVVKAAAGGVSGTHEVEVVEGAAETVRVTEIVLDKSAITMAVGDADHVLTATVKPENASDRTYTWNTSNGAVATVSGGIVHAAGVGEAVISATTSDGNKVASCRVTVKAAEPGKDPTTPGGGVEDPGQAEIKPVDGGPVITKASAGELEAAYVEWTAAPNATRYNVYVSAAGANQWTQLDAPLVRQYQNYYRADAVGLKAGTYDMKVVPVGSNGEAAQYASSAEGITVYAHERAGFAFENNVVPGAYNADGTLKDNARVIYVTEETKNSVSIEITGADTTPCVGVQSIFDGIAKGKETRPLAIRFVGNVTDMSYLMKGDLQLDTKSKIANITIEGVGADATMNGYGFRLKNAQGVEVRNLGFMNCNSDEGDDLGLQQNNQYVWVHNCDFFYGDAGSDADQVKGDGALDTKKSTYVTHSYNHFWDNGKCNLQGMKDETTSNYITYHHNWYDHSDSRHPRIRTCTVHIYNNYFDGNAKYCVGVTMGASAFVENNFFRSTVAMKPMLSSNQGTDALGEGTFSGEAGGIIKSYGNTFQGSYALLTQNDTTADNIDCYAASSRSEKVPATYKTKSGGTTYNNFDTASDMYSYKVDTPEQAKEKVMRYAGRVDGGDMKWTFDNATEDANYAVIPALKAALVAYDDKIIKIGK